MRRIHLLTTALAAAALSLTFVPLESAEAAPTWCRSWRVNGQTWYLTQSNGIKVLLTLKMPASSNVRFGGYARFGKDPNRGGVASQLVRGGVGSEGVGSIHMDIVWTNGSSGQYNGTVYDVERTASGGLTAGLRGTTVDTSGRAAPGARWYANGQDSGIRPLWCPAAAVVR
jgi:hypothetical protein